MDCEDCRHLTVVGLHDTGPWNSLLRTGFELTSLQGGLVSALSARQIERHMHIGMVLTLSPLAGTFVTIEGTSAPPWVGLGSTQGTRYRCCVSLDRNKIETFADRMPDRFALFCFVLFCFVLFCFGLVWFGLVWFLFLFLIFVCLFVCCCFGVFVLFFFFSPIKSKTSPVQDSVVRYGWILQLQKEDRRLF